MNASPRQPVNICLSADDFGMEPGVADAVLRLSSLGRLNATSCMVGAAGWAQSASAARELMSGDIDVGLHLDLTHAPLLRGSRASLPVWIARTAAGAVDRRRLRAEIRAQLDAFEDALGRPPVFVDGHQHVHQFRGVRDELVAELTTRYVGRMPWLRSTRPPAAGTGALPEAAKARLIGALGERSLRALARRHGIAMSGRLLGVYGLRDTARRYPELMARWLDLALDGDVLMCHPATNGGGSEHGSARADEFAFLAGEVMGRLLESSAVRLTRLSPRVDG